MAVIVPHDFELFSQAREMMKKETHTHTQSLVVVKKTMGVSFEQRASRNNPVLFDVFKFFLSLSRALVIIFYVFFFSLSTLSSGPIEGRTNGF